MKFTSLVSALILTASIFSCKAPEDIVYFQNTADNEKVELKGIYEPKFRNDDIISVYVSAPDMDAVRPFNGSQGLAIGTGVANAEAGSAAQQASEYLIDYNGNIEFPVLGNIKIAGFTRVQVQDLLKEKLKTYVNNPIVSVRLKNFKITILGEVNSPGTYTIPNDKISIIEAIGLAGDLTIVGKRKNVTIIRENKNEKVYHKIDLTSKNIFDSPAYFLVQNDVIYVEPNETKIKTSKTSTLTLGIIYSTVGVLLSVLTFALAN